MNKTSLTTSLKKSISRASFTLRKNSPEIFIVAGAIGVGVSFVMACVASTKVNDILEEKEDRVDEIHEKEHSEPVGPEIYTEDDRKKDLTKVYIHTGVEFVKLYAPSAILLGLSLTSMIASNNILRKRNAALATAFAAVSKNFKEYSDRVIERFGEDVDREIRYGVKSEAGDEEDKSKPVVVEENKHPIHSPYAKFFDDGNPNWDKNADANLMFLIQKEAYCTAKLEIKGYLFLNEVYDELDIPKTKVGQVVGWCWKPGARVDFGMYDMDNERKRAFINGDERTILLDFNVDGYILDLVED